MLMTHLLLMKKIFDRYGMSKEPLLLIVYVFGWIVGCVMISLVGIHQGMGLTLVATIIVFFSFEEELIAELILLLLNGMIFGLQSGMIVTNQYNLNFGWFYSIRNFCWFLGSVIEVGFWFFFGSNLFMLTMVQPFFWVLKGLLSHFWIAHIDHTGFMLARVFCLLLPIISRKLSSGLGEPVAPPALACLSNKKKSTTKESKYTVQLFKQNYNEVHVLFCVILHFY